MPTLQIRVASAESEAIPSSLKLVLSFPVFRYTDLRTAQAAPDLAGPPVVTRIEPSLAIQRQSIDRHEVVRNIDARRLRVTVPDYAMLTGTDASLRRRYLQLQGGDGAASRLINLEDASFVVPARVYMSDRLVAESSLELLEILAPRTSTSQETFFVDREAFARLVDRLNLGAFSSAVLLALSRSTRVAENADLAISSADFATALREQLLALYQTVQDVQRKVLVDGIPSALARLDGFDLGSLLSVALSVVVPSLETVSLSGTLAVEGAVPGALSTASLNLYEITAEYPSLRGTRTERVPLQVPADFDGSASVPVNSSLFDAAPGPIVVRVRSPDSTLVWQGNFTPSSGAVTDIRMVVRAVNPLVIGSGGSAVSEESVRKLRGQVVSTGRAADLKGQSVVVSARDELNAPWRVVGAATTDRSGSFSMVYPTGTFVEARAFLASSPSAAVNLELTERINASISDNFLYLVIASPEVHSDHEHAPDGCDCDSLQRAQRLPDQEDLIESDEFTQDLGGGCINLTTPNRTLREYSHHAIVRTSDPDVVNHTLVKERDGHGVVRFRLAGGEQTVDRRPISHGNPVRWQDAPDASNNLSLYQAATVAWGHVLHYKTTFKSDGYSMGDLLYSLPLAPGQKKQIVTFEASHSLVGAESQTLSQGERLSAGLVNDRSITDTLAGSIGESLQGSSSATTAGVSVGLGAGGSAGAMSGSLGVAGGYANSNSSASQNSSRDLSQFFGERLRQSISQNAESYRQLNGTIVSSVQEGQRYGAVTEAVANHNHCHALTMMYFEVLRHYAISQELSHVEECVFVPLIMTNFTLENVFKWRDVLARSMLPLPSHHYLDTVGADRRGVHPLRRAYDAVERIRTNYELVDYPPEEVRYADEAMREVHGTMSLRVDLKRPKTRYDRIKSLPLVTKTITHQEVDIEATVKKNALLAGVPFGFLGMGTETRTVSEDIIVVGQIFDQFMSLDANYASVPPAQCIRVLSFMPRSIEMAGGVLKSVQDEFFEDGLADKHDWKVYAQLLGYMGDDGVYKMLNYYFAGRLISEWDEIFYNDVLPGALAAVVKQIKIEPFAFSNTMLDSYTGGERVIRVRMRSGSMSLTRRALPRELVVRSAESSLFRAGAATLRVEDVKLWYETNHFEGVLHNEYVGTDLSASPTLGVPLTTADNRSPRKEDRLLANALVEHLNSNLEHYNKSIWRSLDPDRRFALLDGFHIETFSDDGMPSRFRSLASVVKNQLLTIAGNSLVFPVASGYRVSRSFQIEEGARDALFDHYRPLTPVPPYRVSVPTRGVYLEAVQGRCNACEAVQPNTSQDWTKFTVDEPTAIAAINTPTPVVTDWKPTQREFATPMVNIQNAPSVPEPGAGLAGLSELLGKSGVFNDVTGLSGNQQNVMATYKSNQENAKAFAEMAQKLAIQKQNVEHSDNFMSTARQERDGGNITQEQYRDLVVRHLEHQIDGGAREDAERQADSAREESPLETVVADAAAEGRPVTAARTGTDGSVESVTVGGAGAAEETPETAPSTGTPTTDPPAEPTSPSTPPPAPPSSTSSARRRAASSARAGRAARTSGRVLSFSFVDHKGMSMDVAGTIEVSEVENPERIYPLELGGPIAGASSGINRIPATATRIRIRFLATDLFFNVVGRHDIGRIDDLVDGRVSLLSGTERVSVAQVAGVPPALGGGTRMGRRLAEDEFLLDPDVVLSYSFVFALATETRTYERSSSRELQDAMSGELGGRAGEGPMALELSASRTSTSSSSSSTSVRVDALVSLGHFNIRSRVR